MKRVKLREVIFWLFALFAAFFVASIYVDASRSNLPTPDIRTVIVFAAGFASTAIFPALILIWLVQGLRKGK
jgi:hypothetical protein